MHFYNRIAYFISVVAVVGLGLLQSAYSYSFTSDFTSGIYWQSYPISITAVGSDAGQANTLHSITTEAIQAWEDQLGVNLWVMSSPAVGGVGGNNIRWSTNFAAETGHNSSSTLAVAIRYATGPYFAKTEIILNANQGRLSHPANLKKVIMHELGHTINLDHSNVLNSIMGAYYESVNGLTSDDINGANAVVSETQARQISGYIAPQFQNQEESNAFSSCGTIDTSGGGGPGGNFLSLLMGLLIVAIMSGIPGIRAKSTL